MRRLLYIFPVVWIFSCAGPTSKQLIEESVLALTKEPVEVLTIMAFANCESPNGKYTTEVHSGSDDYAYFKQIFSYRDNAFEAVVVSADSGFVVSNDSVASSLNDTSIYIIKGHEFHKMLFAIKNWYYDFETPVKTDMDGIQFNLVKAKDSFNNAIELYFNSETKYLEIIDFRNPQNVEEKIRIQYSNWIKVNNVILPMKVLIDQSGNFFTFDYASVKINSVSFRKWGEE